MPVAEAAGAYLERYDPLADRHALERIAEWCEQFSPLVGLEDSARPASLFLDITGLAPLFQGERELAERVVRALARRGLVASVAIAETLGIAWGVTHGPDMLQIVQSNDRQVLAGLPVEALRLSPPMVQVLKELGIQQIGPLLKLPRAGLATRFGQQLLDRLDQFTGAKPEPITLHRALPEIVAEWQFEYPVERRDLLESALTKLVERVAADLVIRQQGVIQLECRLGCQAGELSFVVGLFEASSNSRHLLELLQMQLEQRPLTSPVVSIRLTVLLSARLVYRQRELFAADHNRERDLALLIDRLSSRLGRECVLRAALVADAQPEYAYRYEMLAGSLKRRPAAGERKGLARPLLVEPQPLPLEAFAATSSGPPLRFRLQGEQHHTLCSWGPERIQTGWWRGKYIRRDYYRVESDNGCHYWLFRSSGKWFLHGIFD
jgi:protein ImuB